MFNIVISLGIMGSVITMVMYVSIIVGIILIVSKYLGMI